MKSILCATAIAIVGALTTSAGQVQDLKPDEVYQSVLQSVAALRIETRDGAKTATAFLALRDGIAVTSWHAIEDANRITARFSNGEEFEVSGLVDRDIPRDLALVRIKVSGRPLLKLSAADPAIGSKAFVVGSPMGLDFSISDGLVSQLRTADNVKYVQFTCAASPGNSGGPLLNARAEVLGVVAFQFTTGQNLNFAMPSVYALGLDASLPTTPWESVPVVRPVSTPAARSSASVSSITPSILSAIEPAIPPAELLAAKTAFVGYLSGPRGVLESLPDKLREWKRWTIVSDEQKADILLVLYQSGTSGLGGAQLTLAAVSRSGQKLFSVNCEERMSKGYTAGVLVNRLKDQIAKAEKKRWPIAAHRP